MKNKNKSAKIPQIDLHGLHSSEVFDAVDKFIMKYSKSSYKKIHIMTGKGKGIVNREVKDYLNKAGYPYKALRLDNGKINDGILVIFLD